MIPWTISKSVQSVRRSDLLHSPPNFPLHLPSKARSLPDAGLLELAPVFRFNLGPDAPDGGDVGPLPASRNDPLGHSALTPRLESPLPGAFGSATRPQRIHPLFCPPEGGPRLWKADEGPKAHQGGFGQSSDNARGGVEDRRPRGAQGQRPSVRHRTAQVRLGCPASRNAPRQGAPAALVRRAAGFHRHAGSGGHARGGRHP